MWISRFVPHSCKTPNACSALASWRISEHVTGKRGGQRDAGSLFLYRLGNSRQVVTQMATQNNRQEKIHYNQGLIRSTGGGAAPSTKPYQKNPQLPSMGPTCRQGYMLSGVLHAPVLLVSVNFCGKMRKDLGGAATPAKLHQLSAFLLANAA